MAVLEQLRTVDRAKAVDTIKSAFTVKGIKAGARRVGEFILSTNYDLRRQELKLQTMDAHAGALEIVNGLSLPDIVEQALGSPVDLVPPRKREGRPQEIPPRENIVLVDGGPVSKCAMSRQGEIYEHVLGAGYVIAGEETRRRGMVRAKTLILNFLFDPESRQARVIIGTSKTESVDIDLGDSCLNGSKVHSRDILVSAISASWALAKKNSRYAYEDFEPINLSKT